MFKLRVLKIILFVKYRLVKQRLFSQYQLIHTIICGFWQDFAMPFEETGKWLYNKGKKVDKLADKSLDSAGSVAGGLADILSGNSNVLIYLGIGLVTVIALPKIIDKVL